MRFGWSAKHASIRLYWLAISASVLLVVFYVYIYWFEPFSEFWNNFSSNFFLVLASFLAALTATLIWRHYDRTDGPRTVWGPFAVSVWLWFLGELTWGYLNMTAGDVPVGLPDVFWVSSYFTFGLALLNQYGIVYQPDKRSLARVTWIAVIALFAFTLLIYSVFILATDGATKFDVAVNSFYPAGDLLLAVIALGLARHFAGGAFARPWLGLLVFTFSDLLYAWLEASGTYAWSVNEGNLLSTVSDVAYLAAYLVLFIGVLYQWLFLKYGMLSPAGEK